MALTDYSEEMLLKLALGTSVGSAPSGIWLALGLYDNGTYGPWGESGTGGTEIGTGLGYARAHIPFDGWDPITSEEVAVPSTPSIPLIGQVWTKNTNPIVFGPSTGPWGVPGIFGQLRYGALFDAATGGNCLTYETIAGTPAEGIPINKLMTFPAGSLKVTLRSTFYTDTFAPLSRYTPGGFTRQIMEYLLKHLTGQASYVPGDRYFGISSSINWTNTHNGAFTEITGTNYARVSTAGLWGAPVQSGAGAKIQLTADVPFPTAGSNWPAGTFSMMDAATGGNLVAGFGFTGFAGTGVASGNRLVIRPADLIPRLFG